jgi:nicotinate-nucleotide pyrophosphorylase (carboxylating)
MELGETEQRAARELIRLALTEDLGQSGDITTWALIAAGQLGTVQIAARAAGVLAGLPVARLVFDELDREVQMAERAADGDRLVPGAVIAEVTGRVRSLLAGERTCLNFLTTLSGVATLTRRYVDAVAGTQAGIYDTRKTLPGWRALQKYAVRAGGGKNHRSGLYDMVLIKDNHLAGWKAAAKDGRVAAAVGAARERVTKSMGATLPVEVEVDTLEQLTDALSGQPDIVLLDNMTPDELREAVTLRNRRAPKVALEASGGVSLATVGAIAATGVERISVGALTHSAPVLDIAFDWVDR